MLNRLRDINLVGRLRRAHGLEHATIRVLSEHYPYLNIAGRTTTDGFVLYGDVPTEAVVAAVEEAMRRARAGERHLAVHPRCGTNLAVAGVLAGLSSLAASSGRPRPLVDRLARLTLASTAAILVAQPLGPVVQERVTTSPDFDELDVRGIQRREWGRVVAHRVELGRRAPVA